MLWVWQGVGVVYVSVIKKDVEGQRAWLYDAYQRKDR